MNIVVDCFKLVKGVGKSVGIYNLALNLVRNLMIEQQRTAETQIKHCKIIILGNAWNEEDFNISGVEFVKITKLSPLKRIDCLLWELFVVTKVCKNLNADRVMFPRGFCAMTHHIRDIVIIHDLIPFYYNEHYPGFFGRMENAYIMSRLRRSAQKCNKIVTISNASKADIIKYCRVNADKITVIYNGCNFIEKQEKKYNSDDSKHSYIMAITSQLPHKNAEGILKSYERYCNIADKPLDLVVVGIQDTNEYELTDKTRKKVRCYKFIRKDSELHQLLANSRIFLFLSLAEGFGYPPIEAMQLGVPVICSDTSSLPEVVGDAAVLVEPEDINNVAEKMKELLGDEEKQRELIEKGFKNIERFSWDSRAKLYWKTITAE